MPRRRFPQAVHMACVSHGSPGAGMALDGRALPSPCWAGGRQGMAGQPAWDRAELGTLVLASDRGGSKGRLPRVG